MTAHRSPVRRAAILAATVTAALALGACGADDEPATGKGDHHGTSGASASAGRTSDPQQRERQQKKQERREHNAADVAFAQGMIPHHRQAVAMARLAESRAGSTEVERLAKKIKAAQAPEIETLTGWLKTWGEPVPSGDSEHAAHSGHAGDGGPMPGMMTAEEMAKLKRSSGEDFDRAFLALMVEHHEGAVEMAEKELREGAYRPAKDLADDIIAAQTAEITAMRKLLGEG